MNERPYQGVSKTAEESYTNTTFPAGNIEQKNTEIVLGTEPTGNPIAVSTAFKKQYIINPVDNTN